MNANTQKLIFGILGLAIAGLYILHFTGDKKPQVIEKENDYIPKNVVFINTDSFFKNYKEYQKIEGDMKASQKRAEKKAANQMKSLEKDYMKLMQQAQSGQISMADAQAKEKSLMNRKAAIEKEGQRALKNLASRSEKETKNLYRKLNEYFESNKDKYNADFVMGYQTNGMLLYYNPDNDITSKVVEELNKEKKK